MFLKCWILNVNIFQRDHNVVVSAFVFSWKVFAALFEKASTVHVKEKD